MDTVSRTPITGVKLLLLQEEVESFIESVTDCLPTSPNQFEVYKKAQASDAVCPNRENHLLNNLNRIKSLPDLKLKVMKPPKRLYSQLRGGMW